MRRPVLLSALAVVTAVTAAPAVAEVAPATRVPAPASSIWESFEARDLDGRTWTADELEGRVVLLDFWATWCAPCLAQVPILRQATERFGDRGFLVLGVSLDRGERRDLESFLHRQGIDWPQMHDGRGLDGSLARRFQVDAVPRTFLVDRAGRVVGVDLGGDILLAALPALVESPASSAPSAR